MDEHNSCHILYTHTFPIPFPSMPDFLLHGTEGPWGFPVVQKSLLQGGNYMYMEPHVICLITEDSRLLSLSNPETMLGHLECNLLCILLIHPLSISLMGQPQFPATIFVYSKITQKSGSGDLTQVFVPGGIQYNFQTVFTREGMKPRLGIQNLNPNHIIAMLGKGLQNSPGLQAAQGHHLPCSTLYHLLLRLLLPHLQRWRLPLQISDM